jgi:ABC-type nitrate/sulfonate/bicarbonate transport system substrate-binding protein
MKQAGLTLDDLELVTVPFPEIPTALANKAVDASYLLGPFANRAIAAGDAVVLLEAPDVLDPHVNGQFYFGERFLDPANREVAVRFLVAYMKGQRDMMNDGYKTDEIADIVNKHTQMPVEVWKSSPLHPHPNMTLHLDALMEIQDWHLERGHQDYTEPLSEDQIFETSFLEEALERIGRVEE